MTSEPFLFVVGLSFVTGIWALIRLRNSDLYHREPLWTLGVFVVIGGPLSIGLTVALNHVGELFGVYELPDIARALVWVGFVEELAKVTAFAILTRVFRRYFDEPIDWVIYICAVALGFSLIENAEYAFNQGHGDALQSSFVIALRIFTATPMHMAFSGTIGFALASVPPGRSRWAALLRGYLIASLVHGVYDAILYTGLVNLRLAMAFLILPISRWFNRMALLLTINSPHRKSFADYLSTMEPGRELSKVPCPKCKTSGGLQEYLFASRTVVLKCSLCAEYFASDQDALDIVSFVAPAFVPAEKLIYAAEALKFYAEEVFDHEWQSLRRFGDIAELSQKFDAVNAKYRESYVKGRTFAFLAQARVQTESGPGLPLEAERAARRKALRIEGFRMFGILYGVLIGVGLFIWLVSKVAKPALAK